MIASIVMKKLEGWRWRRGWRRRMIVRKLPPSPITGVTMHCMILSHHMEKTTPGNRYSLGPCDVKVEESSLHEAMLELSSSFLVNKGQTSLQQINFRQYKWYSQYTCAYLTVSAAVCPHEISTSEMWNVYFNEPRDLWMAVMMKALCLSYPRGLCFPLNRETCIALMPLPPCQWT